MPVNIQSSGGGSVSITAPSTASNLTVTLPSASGVIPYGAGAGQIQFPATQNPSADVNCLDDYEEGTWTPTFVNLTVVNGTGAVTHSGWYTKIGRQVTVTINSVATGTATQASTAGSTYCNNLPFGAIATFAGGTVNLSTMSTVSTNMVNSTNLSTPTWTAVNGSFAHTCTYFTT